jgi:hypothetical protein
MYKLEGEIKAVTAFKLWVLSVDAYATTLGHQQIQKQDSAFVIFRPRCIMDSKES